MCSFEWKAILASALVFVAVIDPIGNSPSRMSRRRKLITQVGYQSFMSPLKISPFRTYTISFLREHHALESIREILSPFRSPEALTIKTSRVQGYKCLVSTGSFQAHRDGMLRAFEAHTRIPAKRG